MVCISALISRPSDAPSDAALTEHQTYRVEHRRFAKLLSGWEGTIAAVATKFSRPGLDIDDLKQIGRLALYRAMTTFSTQNNTRFKTYAVTVIANAMRDALRAKRPEATCRTDAEATALFDAEVIEYGDRIVEREVTETLNKWMQNLPARDRFIVKSVFYEGHTLTAVGAIPPDGVPDHPGDHANTVVDDGQRVRLRSRAVRGLEAEPDGDVVRPGLDRVAHHLALRSARTLVGQVTHAPEERVGEDDAEAAALCLLVLDVLTLRLGAFQQRHAQSPTSGAILTLSLAA